jgi:hypothetical protein
MADPSGSNVIPFPTRTRVVAVQSRLGIWACSCGSLTFHLYSDGSVQCANCLEQSQRMTCSTDAAEND